MRHLTICLFIIMLCFPTSVLAEFYKYYDENGNVHFTDDYNRVPADQRPDVKGYTESVSKDEAGNKPGEAKTAKPTGKTPPKGKETEFANQLKDLDQRREALDKEYQGLIEENNKLEQMRKTVKTADEVKKYNQSVNALNKKLQAHDKKRQTYASDVEAYNSKVIDANEDKMKKKPKENKQ